MPLNSRPPWLLLAGVVLALDGFVAWLLGGVALLLSTSVAAVQGRTGDPNDQLVWWAVGLVVVGSVAFLSAWRAVRGVPNGRLLGALVAGGGALLAGAGAWSSLTTSPIDPGPLAVSAGIAVAQLAALAAIVAWRPARPMTSPPQSRTGVR